MMSSVIRINLRGTFGKCAFFSHFFKREKCQCVSHFGSKNFFYVEMRSGLSLPAPLPHLLSYVIIQTLEFYHGNF